MSSVNQAEHAAQQQSDAESWFARYPDRDDRIRARRWADAVHIAQSRELDAMQARIEQGEEPRYFEADGSYWVAYAGDISPANAVENAWIEAQERQGNHVLSDADEQMERWGEERGMNDAAVPERPAFAAPTNALAAAVARRSEMGRPEMEWGGFDR